MGQQKIEGRLNYIKENFNLDDEIVSKIFEFGKQINSNKYNVWLAKEIKKDPDLINNFSEIQLILDWAKNTKADIFRFDLNEAKKAQEEWHKNNFDKKVDIKKLNIPNLDYERVIFRCSDQEHFFYLLTDKDLEYEGKIMKHCVSTYKKAVNNNQCFIISLRDSKNQPHVTLEINTNSRSIVQKRGKANSDPSKKYLKMILEWGLYVSDAYKEIKQDKEILDLLNLTLE